jgi:hypothetical protein
LDEEAENALEEIVKCTGMSISDAIKQGLVVYREIAMEAATKQPSEFFQKFDLGEGGYSVGDARRSKILLKEKLRSKRSRKT